MPMMLVMGLLSGCLWAVNGDFDQSRYGSLITQFKCPVCQGQSIADSSAKVSVSMREQIKEMMLVGRTDQEINEYFTSRFGDKVKFSPDYSGRHHLLWALPLLLFAIIAWRFYALYRTHLSG